MYKVPSQISIKKLKLPFSSSNFASLPRKEVNKMTRENKNRPGCKDVFKSFLVEDAMFSGKLEMPTLHPEYRIPKTALPFSQAISSKEKQIWVHFYEDDSKFERIWNNPKRYIQILKQYDGVISPDFSVYRDMPLVMQFWNIYRSRAIANALQSAGKPVIPNIRFGDERTWEACCLGIPKNSAISIGSHGNLRDADDRRHFKAGLQYVTRALHPSTLVVYGSAPDSIFQFVRDEGVTIVTLESRFSQTHKENA